MPYCRNRAEPGWPLRAGIAIADARCSNGRRRRDGRTSPGAVARPERRFACGSSGQRREGGSWGGGRWRLSGRCSVVVRAGSDEEVGCGAGLRGGCLARFRLGCRRIGVEHERFLVLWVMRVFVGWWIIGVRTGIWIPYRSRVGASRLSQASGLLAPLAGSETTRPASSGRVSARGSHGMPHVLSGLAPRPRKPEGRTRNRGAGDRPEGITPTGGSAPNEAHTPNTTTHPHDTEKEHTDTREEGTPA